MKLLTTLFLLLTTSSYVLADETAPLKQYDVEIIIFEDAHARYINSETWPQPEALPEDVVIQENKTIDASEKNETNSESYKNIPTTILSREYKRINHSSEYNVLLYTAWRQDGLDKNKAFEIDISELSNAHRNKKETNTAIEGKLKLILARYLHIYGDLTYKRKNELLNNQTNHNQESSHLPVTAENNGQNPTSADQLAEYNTYPVKFHRKMRSKTLHYIDHPLVGILIQINPVEKIATEGSQ